MSSKEEGTSIKKSVYDGSDPYAIPAETKDELQFKIVRLAEKILSLHDEEQEALKTIKRTFDEILEDAGRLNIPNEEVRRMLHEASTARGSRPTKISESYFKRLLPMELKHTKHTRKDYQLIQTTKSVFDTKQRQQAYEAMEEVIEDTSKSLKQVNKALKEELVILKEKIAELSEVFEARGLLQVDKHIMPIKVRVNPISKKLESAELDHDTFRQTLKSEAKEKRRVEDAIEEARSTKK